MRKMDLAQEVLALKLLNAGVVKFGAFKLKLHETQPEAPLSPIYINLRTPDNKDGPLTVDLVENIGWQLFNITNKERIEFDLVAGIPRAGEPFAEVVSRWSGKPLIKLGKKVEGDKRKIDAIVSGRYQSGQRILLVDDLITQADTKKEAINVCRGAGLDVVGVVVLLDREQGGSEELKKMGYDLFSAFTLTALLDYYVLMREIEPALRLQVMNYLANNR